MESCFHCGEPATKLCDFHIGQVIGEYVRDGHPSQNRWMAVTSMACLEQGRAFHTCDRPLCDACAVHKGNIFICGELGGVETIDRCKEHDSADDSDAPMLTDKEADSIRRALNIRLTPPRGELKAVEP
jgi:hypothetical protein